MWERTGPLEGECRSIDARPCHGKEVKSPPPLLDSEPYTQNTTTSYCTRFVASATAKSLVYSLPTVNSLLSAFEEDPSSPQTTRATSVSSADSIAGGLKAEVLFQEELENDGVVTDFLGESDQMVLSCSTADVLGM